MRYLCFGSIQKQIFAIFIILISASMFITAGAFPYDSRLHSCSMNHNLAFEGSFLWTAPHYLPRTILRYSANTGSATEVHRPAPSPCQVPVKCTPATENVLLVGILGSWQLRVSRLMEAGLVYVCAVSAVNYRPCRGT